MSGYLGPALGVSSAVGLATWSGVQQQSTSTSLPVDEAQFDQQIAEALPPEVLQGVESSSTSQIPLPSDLSLYGYATSSGLKIVAVLEELSGFTDPDLRSVSDIY